jgi:hypothetical protein
VHKKPTSPFGHLAFSKDGRVHRKIFRLSTVKEVQEAEAMSRFVDTFNSTLRAKSRVFINSLRLGMTLVHKSPEHHSKFNSRNW